MLPLAATGAAVEEPQKQSDGIKCYEVQIGEDGHYHHCLDYRRPDQDVPVLSVLRELGSQRNEGEESG